MSCGWSAFVDGRAPAAPWAGLAVAGGAGEPGAGAGVGGGVPRPGDAPGGGVDPGGVDRRGADASPSQRALACLDEEVRAAVLGPALFALLRANGPLLTVADDRDATGLHTLGDEVVHRRLGAALAQREVVLVGAALVAMP